MKKPALFVPDFQLLLEWCMKEGMRFDNMGQMVEDTRVKKFIEKEVNECNATLGSKVRVHRFKLLGHDWTVEKELTPSYKVRREVILKNNKGVVEYLFKDYSFKPVINV